MLPFGGPIANCDGGPIFPPGGPIFPPPGGPMAPGGRIGPGGPIGLKIDNSKYNMISSHKN